MTTNRRNQAPRVVAAPARAPRRALGLRIGLHLTAILLPSIAHAQIATDGSLGNTPTTFSGPAFEIPSGAGRQSDNLLFFSFSEFGVPEGASVTFTKDLGASPIDTVVSRVTGGSASNILGSFTSYLGEHDFYFLNPWGVLFGSGSSVDVGGSLHVATADDVRAGGETFSARSPGGTILASRPESFGFLSSSDRGALEIRGDLELKQGSTFDLVGGDVTLDGALVWAPGGLVRIAAVDSTGEVVDPGDGSGFDVTADGPLGTIEIVDESIVSVSGLEMEPEPFRRSNELDASGIFALIPTEDLRPGDVVLAQGTNGALLAVLRGPPTGSIFARGGSLLIRDSDLRARAFGADSGSINVDVDGLLEIRKVSSLENVGLLARSESMPITIALQFFLEDTGTGEQFFIPAGERSIAGTGPGPSINVHADDIQLFDGGRIAATSFTSALGGQVVLQADHDILLSGLDNDEGQSPTGIYSNSQGTGDAGNVTIAARRLVLREGGGIFTQTTGNAAAGDIDVTVDRLEIFEGSQIDSSTSAQSLPEGSTDTTSGFGGSIRITARDSVLLSGPQTGGRFGQISTNSETRSAGTAGSIEVVTPRLELRDHARISATTLGPGAGGDVALDVGALVMEDASIIAESQGVGGGAAGSIRIGIESGAHETTRIALVDSEISAFARTGPTATPREGNISLRARGVVELAGDSLVSSSVETGLGGSISVVATDAVIMRDQSAMLATAGSGEGGAIEIDSGSLVPSFELLDQQGRLSAQAGVGTPGVVTVNTPEVNLASRVTPLATPYLDASAELRSACAARMEGEGGSFRVSLHRAAPPTPEDWLLAFDDLGVPIDETPKPVSVSESIPLASNSRMRGGAAFRGGRFEEAERLYDEAVDAATAGDVAERSELFLGRAQAQQARGAYAESIESLETGLSILGPQSDPGLRAALLGSLGNAKLALGDSERAEKLFAEALAIAAKAGRPDVGARIENHRANAALASGRSDEALLAYQRAVTLATKAGRPDVVAIAYSGAARTALSFGDHEEATRLLARARRELEPLPADATKVQLALHLAHTYAELARRYAEQRSPSLLAGHELLAVAKRDAAALGDRRSLSYVLGELGALYEQESRFDEALTLTRRARAEAEAAEATEALAHWHWQEGRLSWAQGRARDALLAYRRAIALLEDTRQESLARYGATSFRKTLAPYYLDFVEALLDSATRFEDGGQNDEVTSLLLETRITMEQLKAAELRDHFRDECIAALEARTADLDQVLALGGGDSAIVYPILLPDRLELLVTLPSGIDRFTVPASLDQVTETSRRFLESIFQPIGSLYRPHAQQLYDWLVRPYAARLAKEGIDTLVFVPDGILRTIPLAALHDGESFLVDHYALAIAPGLSLVDPAPLDRSDAKLLLAGVSKAVQGHDPLPNVPQELESIQALFGGEILLDEDFAAARFEDDLRDDAPSIVHIASHAEFTGDPSSSYLLSYDERLSLEQLAKIVAPTQYRDQPLELLFLSACDTAAGDEGAALGLAGAAIRAGARSAVGSLWRIEDAVATDFVLAFYGALKDPQISKARALQMAQQKVLGKERSKHPYYWSPFILVSNWL